MAEAHQAVAFSFSITHEGWDINYDREVLDLVWVSGVRSWKKGIARFRVSVYRYHFTMIFRYYIFLQYQHIKPIRIFALDRNKVQRL